MLKINQNLLPQELSVLRVEDLEHPQDNINLDAALGQEVAAGKRLPLVRVWRSARVFGIGVSRKDVASEAGASARQTLMDQGCSVIVRQTGGTAVPQGDGVVHLSLLFPRLAERTTTDDYYRLLCDPLLEWLHSYGLQAYTGALPGSYCDGSYNVLVDGKKLIGTAQAWRGGLAGVSSSHPGYILAHACITLDVDWPEAGFWMNRFYELSQDSYRVDETTSVSLSTLTPERWDGLDREAVSEQGARELQDFLAHYYARQNIGVSS